MCGDSDMKRRMIVDREVILERMQTSTIAGVRDSMMTQYLAQARVFAAENGFGEYQAMALKATRHPDGSVEVETPVETEPLVVTTLEKVRSLRNGFLVGGVVVLVLWILWEVVTS